MRLDRRYFVAAAILFVTEVLIALLVHDNFIRPYFGDTLVVILIYCALRAVFPWRMWPTAIGTLLFAFVIEGLQYGNLIHHLGWEDSALARTIIGHSAAWGDIWAYIGGFVLIVVGERLFNKRTEKN